MNSSASPTALSTPTSLPPLIARQLACRRGNSLLFKHLDFEVGAGSIVWLRGQNGRGKTSLLRLVAGLATPEDGKLLGGDAPVRSAPQYSAQLVYIGHTNALKDDLTVSEALAFLLHIHGRPWGDVVAQGALDRMGLQGRRRALVRTLSQGQRRRVALARLAVETGPSTWILDEPFDALDVDGVSRLNGLLAEHAARGGRVLLTSHQSLNEDVLHPRVIDLDRYH